ncbi:MAG TPA: signal peptide peptidase SppA [Candidatus Paceibacterota bacterium]|nr:signal peptide peptidase SppA [Verrucomicrobiota bacterium]HRZ45539.1 signal peptide peptidase SppA [Candidatus Paceibacterota bacterium]HRZ93012.1 signal peptide peptidase SppA [Candidatus Paceibacterota bacterium]
MDDQPPPVYPAPPPMAPAPSHSRRPAGRGWLILGIVTAVVLVFLLLGVVVETGIHLLPRSLGMGPALVALDETLIENNRSSSKIAVLEVSGLITGGYLQSDTYNSVNLLVQQLKRAAADTAVKAVILRVDSPGGEVMAADEMYRALIEFQNETDKPVVASMGGLAASGGYYISAPCRWILAHELTLTGSIGVIMHGFNYRGLLDKVGVRPEVYKSGRFKDMLSGSKREEEIAPEERAMVQTLIDRTFDHFKQVVRDGRDPARRRNPEEAKALSRNWEQFADGRILSGREACDLGFIDELGDFKAAVQRALKLAGIPNANLVRYDPPAPLFDIFSWLAESRHNKVKIDLGMGWPPPESGRLYFLSPALPR